MKCIIGIGNPEEKFSGTRHNIGKDLLNHLILKAYSDKTWEYNKYTNCDEIVTGEAIFCKPYSFMNTIGEDVKKFVSFHEIDLKNILIIYDELDLFSGEYKLAQSKYSKIHNGIRSITSALKNDEVWYLRIGVRDESIPDSVQKTGRDPGEYVLSKLPKTDSEKIFEMTDQFVINELRDWLSKK